MELTRRGAIRLAGVAGLAATTGAVLAAVPASPALASQYLWLWCHQCQGLWFGGNYISGACPATGITGHSLAGSGAYTLPTDSDNVPGQRGWVWCNRCQGLWYGRNSTCGACPAGPGGHDSAGSGGYTPMNNSGGGQGDWRWCRQCQGMWFAANRHRRRVPGSRHRRPQPGRQRQLPPRPVELSGPSPLDNQPAIMTTTPPAGPPLTRPTLRPAG